MENHKIGETQLMLKNETQLLSLENHELAWDNCERTLRVAH
jgi:hypothetical protein